LTAIGDQVFNGSSISFSSSSTVSFLNMTGELVFITGANGFVGAHVLRELLSKGYRARVAVRSQAKADDVARVNPQHKNQIESYVIVPDITAPGAFDQAIQGSVDYVMHVASPFTYDIKDNKKDLLLPAVEGTKNILQAASTQKSIKRVIITSSFAAMVDTSKGLRPGYTYTEKDWNPATWDEACKSENPGFVYCASKKFAEAEAWDFVKNKKPSFDIATMCKFSCVGVSFTAHID
jgi:nucleoside-diphosphate-sugar epimerase